MTMTIAESRVDAAQRGLRVGRLMEAEQALRHRYVRWQRVCQQGRITWSGVELSDEELLAHVRDFDHSEVPAPSVELYLAAACCLGRQAAIRALEREYVERLQPSVKTVVRESWVVDDILQELRWKLLVGPSAKMAHYRGTGPLGSWMRAIALNIARDYVRAQSARQRRENVQSQLQLFGGNEHVLADDDLGRCAVRQGRAAACSEAVRRAVQSLLPDERRLLQDYFWGQLSIDVLGVRYLVNRATIARRINRSTEGIRRRICCFLAVNYPRENARTLDALARLAFREALVDAAALFE